MMSKELWLVVDKWSRVLGMFDTAPRGLINLTQFAGDVMYLSVWGQPVVFLNSRRAAYELLDKRGIVYSDRPRNVMGGEL